MLFACIHVYMQNSFVSFEFDTSDLSLENLRHLSSQQALADLAHFTEAMNDAYNLTVSKETDKTEKVLLIRHACMNPLTNFVADNIHTS